MAVGPDRPDESQSQDAGPGPGCGRWVGAVRRRWAVRRVTRLVARRLERAFPNENAGSTSRKPSSRVALTRSPGRRAMPSPVAGASQEVSMSDFHQHGPVTALPRLVNRPIGEFEARILALSQRFTISKGRGGVSRPGGAAEEAVQELERVRERARGLDVWCAGGTFSKPASPWRSCRSSATPRSAPRTRWSAWGRRSSPWPAS